MREEKRKKKNTKRSIERTDDEMKIAAWRVCPSHKKNEKKSIKWREKKREEKIKWNTNWKIIPLEVSSHIYILFFPLMWSSCVHQNTAFLYRRMRNLWFCVGFLFVFIHFNEFYTSYLPLALKFTFDQKKKKKVLRMEKEPSVNKRIYYTNSPIHSTIEN